MLQDELNTITDHHLSSGTLFTLSRDMRSNYANYVETVNVAICDNGSSISKLIINKP